MRTIIITQNEPFYLPIFMDKLLSGFKDIMAIVILPGVPKGFNFSSYVKRLYDVFGLKDFLIYTFLFLHHKFFDLWTLTNCNRYSYSIRSIARKYRIPVYKLKNINSSSSIRFLKSLKPEVLVSVAAPQVFGKELIHLAKHTINIHASLLPRFRGMMPSFWVLAKGESKTGVTVHYMNERIDRGNIILQKVILISPKETLHSLQIKVANKGAEALIEALSKIEKGEKAIIVPNEGGNYYSFPTKEAAKEFRARGWRFI